VQGARDDDVIHEAPASFGDDMSRPLRKLYGNAIRQGLRKRNFLSFSARRHYCSRMSKIPPLSRQILSNLELFRGLPPTALDDVLATASTRSFARDFRVFNQGETRVRAHLLVDGWIRISQSGSDGAQIVVRFIGPGDIFGAISLFTDRRYPADADTLTDATEVSWSDRALLDLMNNHPQIAINAVRIVGQRLQEAQHRVRELATQRAEQRVAHALLRLLRQVGTTTSRGIVIRFPLRRKDIADIAGTTLYSASRILSAWERAGWLKTLDRRIAVESLSELMRIAEDENGKEITPLPP
jgi:CRP-like cAMP-binding protein